MIKIVNQLPSQLNIIESAVRSFIEDSHCKEDKVGLYNQTLQNIAAATYFNQPGNFFWLDIENNEVIGYVLTHVSKDIDNTLCYYMTQAWICPKYRHTNYAKEAISKLREHAKQLLCKHIIIPSSRGWKGYCRFMGAKWHPYVTLLKEDL